VSDSSAQPVRVLRVIARMNVGGPAHHVSILGGRADRERYETLLVHGNVGSGEASLADLAHSHGAQTEEIRSMGPKLHPVADAQALWDLIRIVRRFNPDIIDTHTAKAGVLGRIAALVSKRSRPIVVHTYHGHVLEGYFGAMRNRVFRMIERSLGRVTDCLIGVSSATVDDLVRLGVAPPERFRVVPVGLDLDRFVDLPAAQGADLRAQVGARDDEVLLTAVGRLVPIKRVDVLLRALAIARAAGAPVRLAIVGDGDSRPELEVLARDLEISDAVTFLGYRLDTQPVFAATDVAVLSSDNEGTPFSLIEAAAAGRPAIATAVGGVPDVVGADTGILVPRGDPLAFGEAIGRLAADPGLRAAMGARAREHVLSRFTSDRLVRDVDALYRELLATPARRGSG
jgi:glycosyltransferase involved in cell wall biosynthesis